MHNGLVGLLGIDFDALGKSALVLSLNEQPTTKQIEDRIYLKFVDAGIAFDIETADGKVAAIFLYSEGLEGYKQFSGALPEGISFSSSRSNLQSHIGKPSASGGGQIIQPFGKTNVWDRFDRENYCLHVRYADDEASINLVTLMRPESVPK